MGEGEGEGEDWGEGEWCGCAATSLARRFSLAARSWVASTYRRCSWAARSSMRLRASGDLGADVASCRRASTEAPVPSGERTVQPSSSWTGMTILLAPYSCLSSCNSSLVVCEGEEEG